MPDLLVRAKRLDYRYPEAAAQALRDITLELGPGSFTVLAGTSGSGKSTLLRALCGLVPHFHGGEVAGELEVGGMSVRDHGPGELAAVCGTVFQDPETQVVLGGVRAELSLPLEHRGEGPAAIARAVEEVALTMGIAHLLDRRTDTLSGGELQRVAIGAALVHRPALLLLDEPTSQLDPVAGDELIWLLRRLNEEWGTAVVIAEHRLERCLAAADRVVGLEGGAVVCDSSPGEFLVWATAAGGKLVTPVARLFSLAGLGPLPTSVKDARAQLRGAQLTATHRAPPIPAPRSPAGGKRTALRARGVWYEIEEGPQVLRDVHLRLIPGERVALMGRNGAGKSTLLRHLKGLLEPTRGLIERTGPVALLMQNPGDYLIHEHAAQEAGEEALAAAGLAGRGAANPRDLSGGERQRLALARLLSNRPQVLLLDEPTANLDEVNRGRVEAVVVDYLEANHACALWVSHDVAQATRVAGRVIRMADGRLQAPSR